MSDTPFYFEITAYPADLVLDEQSVWIYGDIVKILMPPGSGAEEARRALARYGIRTGAEIPKERAEWWLKNIGADGRQ